MPGRKRMIKEETSGPSKLFVDGAQRLYGTTLFPTLPAARTAAVRYVAERSADAAEALDILEMLGLNLEDVKNAKRV